MKEFGSRYFEQTAYINFDENTRIREVFSGSLEIERLLLAISAETGYVPLEVKAEENLRAKSLRVFHDKYATKISIRTSMSDYRREDRLVNIPLYCLNNRLWALCEMPDTAR